MGAEFGIDPVAILEELDDFKTATRYAAFQHLSAMRKKEQDEARKNAKTR